MNDGFKLEDAEWAEVPLDEPYLVGSHTCDLGEVFNHKSIRKTVDNKTTQFILYKHTPEDFKNTIEFIRANSQRRN